jgi:hypothetical protein
MARRKHRAKALVAGWWRVVAVVCGVVAVVGVATAAVLWRAEDEATPPSAGESPAPERAVGLTVPSGGQVSQVERLVGTVKGLRAGEEVWVLIRRSAAEEAYYPASGPCLSAGETLTCPDVTIGGAASKGTFELVPVVVDGRGQRELVDYLRGAGKQSSGPGMARLPQGTVEHGPTVKVTRRP